MLEFHHSCTACAPLGRFIPPFLSCLHRFSFFLDYATVIAPGVLVFTVLADHCGLVLALMLALSLAVLLYTYSQWHGPATTYHDRLPPYPRRAPFATVSRAYINLFTAIAILAVDFPIFPRRLAKAETYGTGLMDVGVGAFLMAHGVTAPEARHPEVYGKMPSLRMYSRMLLLTARSVLPLFVLGLLRLAAVKSAGYQEHVTEYGVHWNFFFTVAVVRVGVELLSRYTRSKITLVVKTEKLNPQLTGESPPAACSPPAALHCPTPSTSPPGSLLPPCPTSAGPGRLLPGQPLPRGAGGLPPLGTRGRRLSSNPLQCQQGGAGVLCRVPRRICWEHRDWEMDSEAKVEQHGSCVYLIGL